MMKALKTITRRDKTILHTMMKALKTITRRDKTILHTMMKIIFVCVGLTNYPPHYDEGSKNNYQER